MATRRFDGTEGGAFQDVAEQVGTAIAPSAIRVTADMAKSKLTVLRQLRLIEARIKQMNWPV